MPFHFCGDELMAIMMLVPGIPFAIMKAKQLVARIRKVPSK